MGYAIRVDDAVKSVSLLLIQTVNQFKFASIWVSIFVIGTLNCSLWAHRVERCNEQAIARKAMGWNTKLISRMVSDKRFVNSKHTSNEIYFVGLFERVHFNVAASRTACTVYATHAVHKFNQHRHMFILTRFWFLFSSLQCDHTWGIIPLCLFDLLLFFFSRFSGNEVEFSTLDYLLRRAYLSYLPIRDTLQTSVCLSLEIAQERISHRHARIIRELIMWWTLSWTNRVCSIWVWLLCLLRYVSLVRPRMREKNHSEKTEKTKFR